MKKSKTMWRRLNTRLETKTFTCFYCFIFLTTTHRNVSYDKVYDHMVQIGHMVGHQHFCLLLDSFVFLHYNMDTYHSENVLQNKTEREQQNINILLKMI